MIAAITLAAALVVPLDSTSYLVLNHGRPAGDMVVARTGDSVTVRYRFVDRNRGTRLEHRYRILANGTVVAGESRPLDLDDRAGEPTDRFELVADSVRRSGRGGVTVTRLEPGVYYGVNGTPYDQALMARFLLRQPQYAAKLPGSAPVRLEIAKELVVPTATGRQHVRMAMIHVGSGSTPNAVWLDDHDGLFASQVGWFITIRPGAEAALPALRAAETAYRDAEAEAMAKRLARPVAGGTLVIANGDVFDSERGVMRPRTTVVVRGDRIVAVGPADSVTAPAGATVIDAAGKTVMPGLWDMHGHLQLTSETAGSVMQLATGLTTVRDMASDVDVAVSQRDRSQAGRIVSPHIVLAGFLEGPGRWAGPSDVLVRTEDEARAWVARYDSMGYKQIKVYNLVHPDLIPTIAAEAHRRGMRLSGHIPRGLTVPAAVQLGFDEVNHAAFLFSTFFQDSLYVPTMRAYSAVAQAVAPNVDVDGAEMTRLIDFLKAHGTVIDGTFNIWVSGTPGAPNVGQGQPADVQKADANYLRLLKRLYDAGVTLVPGTDNNFGSTYNNEVELYERAGVPAPEVLRMATIVSARVMKEDRDYGSIAPGKVADIIIVDGRPAEHVADLRKLQRVIRAGRVYDPQELREAVGFGRR